MSHCFRATSLALIAVTGLALQASSQSRNVTFTPYGTRCGVTQSGALTTTPNGDVIRMRVQYALSQRVFGLYLLGLRRANLSLPGLHCPIGVEALVLPTILTDSLGNATVDLPLLGPGSYHFYGQAALFSLDQPPRLQISDGVDVFVAADLPRSIVEDFFDGRARDPERDGGIWSQRQAKIAQVGGSGILGDFTPEIAATYRQGVTVLEWKDLQQTMPEVMEIDLDKLIVSAQHTLVGRDVQPGGTLDFLSFFVPQGVTVRFVGTPEARIQTTGRIEILGTLDASGGDSIASYVPNSGQSGAPGGPGGGKGGRGADAPFHVSSTSIGQIDGQDGDVLQLPQGHPGYSLVARTAGRGSIAHPRPLPNTTSLSQYNQQVRYSAWTAICQLIAAGGGGGAHRTGGTGGSAFDAQTPVSGPPVLSTDLGAASAASSSLDPFNFAQTGTSAFFHANGGAGGGGAGTSPIGSIVSTPPDWSSGGGGAGGGGVLWLRAGQRIVVGPNAEILAEGGDSVDRTLRAVPQYFGQAPGGAGSGGSILMQSQQKPELLGGVVSVNGGSGGYLDTGSTLGIRARSGAGDGGAGLARVEVVSGTMTPQELRGFVPAPHPTRSTGALAAGSADSFGSIVSTWYPCNPNGNTRFVRYEIQAQLSSRQTFSDDSRRSPFPALETAEVTLFVQGGKTRNGKTSAVTPWFVGAVGGLNSYDCDSVRYVIRLRRTSTADPRLDLVRIDYR